MKTLEIKENKKAALSINPDIFALEVMYSAAYVLMDKAYFMFSGDPSEEIQVEIIPKEEKDVDLKKVALKFNNEMINYSAYAIQASRNKEIRAAIIEKALGTNQAVGGNTKEEGEVMEAESSDREFGDIDIEDPKGIAEPWSPDKAPENTIYEEDKEYEG